MRDYGGEKTNKEGQFSTPNITELRLKPTGMKKKKGEEKILKEGKKKREALHLVGTWS